MSSDPHLLRRSPVFAALSVAEQSAVMAAASLRSLPAGKPAFTQSETADALFLAVSGRIKLTRTGWAHEPVILRIIHPGELFGIGENRHSATAIALCDSNLAVWPMRAWQRLVHDIPALAFGLAGFLQHELAGAQDRLVELASLDVPRRIAHAVLRLIDQAGQQEAGGVRIDFPVSRQDLAALTGTTLHSVSRILTRWGRQGIIAGGRQTLLVRDIPALIRLATATGTDAAA